MVFLTTLSGARTVQWKTRAIFMDYSDDVGSKSPWTALKMKAANSNDRSVSSFL